MLRKAPHNKHAKLPVPSHQGQLLLLDTEWLTVAFAKVREHARTAPVRILDHSGDYRAQYIHNCTFPSQSTASLTWPRPGIHHTVEIGVEFTAPDVRMDGEFARALHPLE